MNAKLKVIVWVPIGLVEELLFVIWSFRKKFQSFFFLFPDLHSTEVDRHLLDSGTHKMEEIRRNDGKTLFRRCRSIVVKTLLSLKLLKTSKIRA